MGDVAVRVDQLVLGKGRAAARAPDHRTVALIEPAALVDVLQKTPDVADVRVREGVVVVVPVHPLAEPDRLTGLHLRELGDPFATTAGELGKAVFLDLTLRVQAEGLLDFDLDPEPLTVEAVLVALIEPVQRLVTLKDVLEGSAPRVVDAHRTVGCDGAVDEAPGRATRILRPELLEDVRVLPPGKELPLQGGVIRDSGKRREDRLRRHEASLVAGPARDFPDPSRRLTL